MNRMIVYVGSILVDENRNEGGQGDIAALAANIKEFGQISAVTLVSTPEDPEHPYKVVDGRRRIAAFLLLSGQNPDDGWDEITADIYAEEELPGGEEAFALAANTARLEMNPLDEGIAFARMLADGKDAGEIAAVFCRTKAQVYQRARLASLPDAIKAVLGTGKLDTIDAVRLAELGSEAQQLVAEKITSNPAIQRWEIRDLIDHASNDIIGYKYPATHCENCQRRTHFDDASLFPELNCARDICLDHECFMRSWKKILADAVSSAPKTEDYIILGYNETVCGAKAGEHIDIGGRDFAVVSTCAVGKYRVNTWWDRSLNVTVHTALVPHNNGTITKETFVFAGDEAAAKRESAKAEAATARKERLESVPPAAREACMNLLTDKQEAALLDVTAQGLAFDEAKRLVDRNEQAQKLVLVKAILTYKYYVGDHAGLVAKYIGLADTSLEFDEDKLLSRTAEELKQILDAMPIMLIAGRTSYAHTYDLASFCRAAGLAFDDKAFMDKCVRILYKDEIEAASPEVPDEPFEDIPFDYDGEGTAADDDETGVSDDEHRDVTDLSKISDADELRANSKN